MKAAAKKSPASTSKSRAGKAKAAASARAETKRVPPKLASVWRLFGQSCVVLARNWKLFGGILVIYAIIYIVLVGGISNSSLSDIKSSVDQTLSGGFGALSAGLTVFTYLISSSSATASSSGGAYQTVLILLFSVILIWTLRQVYSGGKVRIRDGFYSGVYPIIPFILVLIVVFIQLIPMVLGVGLYSTIVGGGIAVNALENILVAALSLLLTILSIYMLLSSVFALYIVTLPEMTPIKALRSARQLARGRRLIIFWKIFFMIIAIFVIGAVIVAPIAIFATVIVSAVFFGLGVVALALVHSYMYALYRELIN